MDQNGFPPNDDLKILLLNSTAVSQDPSIALETLNSLSKVVQPSIRIYNYALMACGASGDYNSALKVMQLIKGANLKADLYSFEALVTAYAEAKDIDGALNVLEDMSSNTSLKPSIKIFNIVLNACAKSGDINRAVAMVRRLQATMPALDHYSYSAVILAAVNAGKIELAIHVLHKLCGVVPSGRLYRYTVGTANSDMDEANAKIEQDWQFLKPRSPGANVHMLITPHMFNHIIGGLSKMSRSQSDIAFVHDAREIFEWMKKTRVLPDLYTFCMLLTLNELEKDLAISTPISTLIAGDVKGSNAVEAMTKFKHQNMSVVANVLDMKLLPSHHLWRVACLPFSQDRDHAGMRRLMDLVLAREQLESSSNDVKSKSDWTNLRWTMCRDLLGTMGRYCMCVLTHAPLNALWPGRVWR